MHDHLFVKLLSEKLGCVYNVKYTFISNDNACLSFTRETATENVRLDVLHIIVLVYIN